MKLKILLHQKPPNFEAVAAVFPAARKAGVMFTYGAGLFIPIPTHVTPAVSDALMSHEQVHCDRQIAMGVEAWWARYLVDAAFRFEEELVAHQAEYRWFDGKPRAERRFMLRHIAARLSGPLYGKMVTMHRAKQLITGRESPDA